MERVEPDYKGALRAAERFLERWKDRITTNVREDLAQEAVVESWKRMTALREPDRFEAYVRTVARRLRYHELRRCRRLAVSSLDADAAMRDRLIAQHPPAEPALRVEGEWIETRWLRARLGRVLRRLDPLNRRLLRGFYAGSTLAELAARHGLTVPRVKARLHRGRCRLRREFAELVRRERQ